MVPHKFKDDDKIRWEVGGIADVVERDSKLRNFYTALRKEVLPAPLENPQATMMAGCQHHYGWQLYQTEGSIVTIEYEMDSFFGDYGHIDDNSRSIADMNLTLHHPTSKLEKQIGNLIRRYVISPRRYHGGTSAEAIDNQ